MKLLKPIIGAITLGMLLVGSVHADEKLSKEEFKKKIESIMNAPKVLTIDSPEQYIYNLDTTQFVKGLMYETSIVLKFLSENSKDKQKLAEFNREFTTNSQCFSIVIGNADNHFKTLFELTLKTPEEKANFNEAYSYMVDTLPPYQLDAQYSDLCKEEKIKANQYYEKHKKS